MSDYPKWIGLWGWTIGERRKHGSAVLLAKPGKVVESETCEHDHRTAEGARKCGQRMAADLNAMRRDQIG
jgi:hypothetical protein